MKTDKEKNKDGKSHILQSADNAREWLDTRVRNGFFGTLFGSHDNLEAYHRSGFLHSYFFDGDRTARWKEKIAEKASSYLSSAWFPHLVRSLGRSVLTEPMNNIGLSTAVFSVFVFIRSCVPFLLPDLFSLDYSYFFLAAILLFASFPLLLAKGSVACGLRNSLFLRSLLFDAFGVPNEALSRNTGAKNHRYVFFLLGAILGVLTFLLSPFAILLFTAFLSLGLIILSVPEIGFLTLTALLPVCFFFKNGEAVFIGLLLIAEISYWLKVFSGKRLCRMGVVDITVLLIGVSILFSGLVGGGGIVSVRQSILYALFTFSYFPIVGLFGQEEWPTRIRRAIVIAGYLSVVFLLVSEIGDIAALPFFKTDAIPVLTAFLLPFLLDDMIFATRKGASAFSFLCFTSAIAGLLAGGYYSVLGLILFLCVLFVCRNVRGTAKWLIPLVLVTIAVLVWLPIPYDRVLPQWHGFSFARTAEQKEVREGVLSLLKEFGLSGIGFGREPFEDLFVSFTPSGFFGTVPAISVYLRVVLDIGIFGAIPVFAFFVFWLIDLISARKIARFQQGDRMISAAILAVSFVGLYGIYNDFISVSALYVLLWLILGTSSATAVSVRKTWQRTKLSSEGPDSAELDYTWEVHHE